MISDEEIKARAENIGSMPLMMRNSVINEFESMSEGDDCDGIRQEYYPTWEDSDFLRVVEILKAY
jgi:hypothetical protein